MGLLEDAEQHREARRKRQQRSIIVAAKGLLILFGALVLLVALAGGLVLGLLESWHFLALILGVTRPAALLRHPARHWFTIVFTVSAVCTYGRLLWRRMPALLGWRDLPFLPRKRQPGLEQTGAKPPEAKQCDPPTFFRRRQND